MNFFSKNRLIFWVLIILVAVNIAALVSFFVYPKTQVAPACCPPEEQQCIDYRDELNLSEKQTLQVNAINKQYMESAEPIAKAIKEARAGILTELEEEAPDTMKLDTLAHRLAMLQLKIQKENIKQYSALKRVCTKEQAHRLSALYRDLYGCPMQKDQVKHRYRHGQSNSQKATCE